MPLSVRTPSRDTTILLGIAAAKLALNVAFHGQYGYFRDELYYLACSEHLAAGYVDHPPLSIFVLAATRALLGSSLHAIRFPAALAGAVVVVLTGLMARRLGGGPTAQALAALAAALSPVILGNGARSFSMNAFDLMFWAWGAYLVLGIVLQDRPRLWPAFGAVAGLGLLKKYSMLFFGFGLFVGLLATRERRHLAGPWIWLGGLLAAVLFLPHVAWEAAHGWPSLEFTRNASQEKNVALPVGEFFATQLLQTGPGQSFLWLAGLAYVALHPLGRRLRLLAWLYVTVFVVMALNGAKAYYLTPVYPPFLAAGAVWLEELTCRGRRVWVRPAFAAVLVALSLVVLPFAAPCLPVDDFIRYARWLGLAPKPEERHALEELPQYYADQFGWEELAGQVAGIYRGLGAAEREGCVIFVRNYGEAAAIDFFGRRHGLPRAICAHNAYWTWGPGTTDMRVAIVMGGHATEAENLADLRGPGRFGEARLAAVTDCRHCMPFERGRQIFVCRDPQFTFQQIWDGERFYE